MEEHKFTVILTIMMAFVVTSQAENLGNSRTYFGGRCMKNQGGTYRVALQFCDGKSWRTQLQPGTSSGSPQGSSCLDILNKGLSYGDGEYIIDPDEDGVEKSLLVYCDMTSFGGGWTMCYTTNEFVNMKTELTTSPAHGYRADCNNIPFTSVMFVDEKSKQKAVFANNGSTISIVGNYNKKADAYGLWTAKGKASTQYKYQLLICDTSFYKGLHISGYTNCYKICDNWCGDRSSPYFRTSARKYYTGVAFNENGHQRRSNRLVSAGIR